MMKGGTGMNNIVNLLPAGKENAVPAKYLVGVTGVSSKRELNHRIRAERLNGALILSTKANGGGYYRPKNRQEIQEFVDSYKGEAIATFAMMKTARDVLKVTEGQEALNFDEEGDTEND